MWFGFEFGFGFELWLWFGFEFGFRYWGLAFGVRGRVWGLVFRVRVQWQCSGLTSRSEYIFMTQPGEQNPHWEPGG